MTQSKTFVLKRKKTFRRGVTVFVKDIYGKLSPRVLKFSTEHLVPVKLRKTRARVMPAEYTTSNPDEIDALLCDLSYGKDFFLIGDPEGKLKRDPRIVSKMDSEKMALKGLFEMINLPFDETKPLAVLEQMYKIQASALSGRKIEKVSGPTPITIKTVDVAQSMADTAAEARKIYEDKYNKLVPEEVTNDFGFLAALGDPDFDAEKYIANLGGEPVEEETNSDEPTIKELQDAYFKKFKTNVANSKKNNAAWIKNKLAE